jgi:hypothetical protein
MTLETAGTRKVGNITRGGRNSRITNQHELQGTLKTVRTGTEEPTETPVAERTSTSKWKQGSQQLQTTKQRLEV